MATDLRTEVVRRTCVTKQGTRHHKALVTDLIPGPRAPVALSPTWLPRASPQRQVRLAAVRLVREAHAEVLPDKWRRLVPGDVGENENGVESRDSRAVPRELVIDADHRVHAGVRREIETRFGRPAVTVVPVARRKRRWWCRRNTTAAAAAAAAAAADERRRHIIDATVGRIQLAAGESGGGVSWRRRAGRRADVAATQVVHADVSDVVQLTDAAAALQQQHSPRARRLTPTETRHGGRQRAAQQAERLNSTKWKPSTTVAVNLQACSEFETKLLSQYIS